MYRCQNCGEVQRPHVKQHKVIIGTRSRTYKNKVDGIDKVSFGSEIVKEVVVCPACEPVLKEKVER